ncbi:MAG: hypothetical protein LBW85_05065 [Deltaproteobacteria bacterium]|nr:hypothetical protein [Deltaproteobacteria bacterium]
MPPVALSAVFLALLAYFCGAGIDFSDEGYYLFYITNPRDYAYASTLFGYLYAPFFRLFGEDMALLRAFSALTLAASAFLLFAAVFRVIRGLPLKASLALATAASASCASFYTLWIPTPSYNSLNLLGLAVTASGMALSLGRLTAPPPDPEEERFRKKLPETARASGEPEQEPGGGAKPALSLAALNVQDQQGKPDCGARPDRRAAQRPRDSEKRSGSPGPPSSRPAATARENQASPDDCNLPEASTTARRFRKTLTPRSFSETWTARASMAGWLLIGIGGWACFMAKPPTAASLAALVLLWAIPAKGYRPGRLPLSAASALVLCLASAVCIDGSPAAFAARFSGAFADAESSGAFSEYGLFAALGLENAFRAYGPRALAAGAALFALGAVFGRAATTEGQGLCRIILAACAGLFVLTLACDLDGGRHSLLQGWGVAALLAGVWLSLARGAVAPAAAAGEAGAVSADAPLRDNPGSAPEAGQIPKASVSPQSPRPARATAAAFVFLPFLYGFGSNNPLIYTAPAASLFFVAAFAASAPFREGPSGLRILAGAVILCQLLSFSGLAASWARPYRQPGPLWNMTAKAPIREGRPELRLAPNQARFLGAVRVLAAKSGMPPGTPLIDMTGRSPTAAYASGGRTFVSPFLVAGYGWSDGALRSLLRRLPCEIASKAWLLWSDRPIVVPFSVAPLAEIGLSFPEGYNGAFLVTSGFAGTGQDLYFLKPKDPEAAYRACRSASEARAAGQ